jgi:hypothetical protein
MEDGPAFLRGEACAFRIEEHGIVGTEITGKRAHTFDLSGARPSSALHEAVGKPMPDDVETRIPQELSLEHVAQPVAAACRQENGCEQGVADAHVPKQQEKRSAPGRNDVVSVDLDVHAE